ncbi:hypothetical protein [Aquamicrobium defluvii]|nr:hypothetical protein [Aquamicrobium defluvii]
MTEKPATNSATVHQLQRLPDGRFAPGSGGRIPGSRNRISSDALAAVRSMKDEAIAQLRTRLQAGDWSALQFILERVLPKGRPIELDSATPSAITDALINGTITSEEAKNLATVLEKIAAIAQVTELHDRIEKLEAIANEKK